MPPTGDVAHNPGMCSDWEWNQWPFGSQASTQSTEPHQPGLIYLFFNIFFTKIGNPFSHDVFSLRENWWCYLIDWYSKRKKVNNDTGKNDLCSFSYLLWVGHRWNVNNTYIEIYFWLSYFEPNFEVDKKVDNWFLSHCNVYKRSKIK